MAETEDTGGHTGKAGLGSNSFVFQKTGPLPNWAWMAIGLGGALVWAYFKKKKSDAANGTGTGTTNGSGTTTGKNGSANGITYAFVDADSTVNTLNAAPPGGGRRPHGPDTPPPPTPAPDGQYVTVTKWTRNNAPWNSTLYGIATELWGNGDAWKAIWNAPENASLKSTRKTPEQIEPGDKVWVPSANTDTGSSMPRGHNGPDGWSGNDSGNSGSGHSTTHRNKDYSGDSNKGRTKRSRSNA